MDTNGHMEGFEQMDLKEQQNIIDSVIYAFVYIGFNDFVIQASMLSYIQD